MAWYVLLSGPAKPTKDHPINASVVQANDAADFMRQWNIDPAKEGVPGQTSAGFPTKAQAQAAADAVNKQTGGSSSNAISTPPAPTTPGDVAAGVSGALGIKDPLAPLFQNNIWLRVGQVALGLILIAVGVAKLTNTVPIATKIAGLVK